MDLERIDLLRSSTKLELKVPAVIQHTFHDL